MPDSFKSLKEVFNKVPELKTIRDIVKSSDIVNDFQEIFPDLEKIVSRIKTNKKTLLLKVDNPAWRQELKQQEENIIKKINSFYKEERINQIRFI
jgi:hypothetical protein